MRLQVDTVMEPEAGEVQANHTSSFISPRYVSVHWVSSYASELVVPPTVLKLVEPSPMKMAPEHSSLATVLPPPSPHWPSRHPVIESRKPMMSPMESVEKVFAHTMDGFMVLPVQLQWSAPQLCPNSWAERSVVQPKEPQQSDSTTL